MKMSVKKTIAIVGATEKTGKIISEKFSSLPYRLLLVSKDLEESKKLFQVISSQKTIAEIDLGECVKDGCWEADIIILAVSHCDEKDAAEKMKEVATQKIVVKVSNEKNIDKDLKEILPFSKLVKAFGDFDSKQIFITGENHAVNEEILSIFNEAGFNVKLASQTRIENANN